MVVRYALPRRAAALALMAAALVAGCHSMPASDSRSTSGSSMATSPMAAKPLYERLGGQAAIVAVVDDFVGNVAADKRINRHFERTDVPRLKRLLVEQICAGTGGPCKYTGRDMRSAHRGLAISDGDFGALVEDLVLTLDKFNVPKKEQGELIAILAPMKPDVVGQ